MKKLYCFDFDGTLTYKDTMFMFLEFFDSKKFYKEFIKHTPLFLMLKFKLVEAENVKKSFISSILKGQKREKLAQVAQDFFEHHYPDIIRENALDFINNINRETTESLIVTASLDIWVQPFATHFNMPLLATVAEYKDDVFTGNFVGKNCNGAEKVRRIKNAIENKKFDKTLAFGDTSGDKQMLSWANESHYQFFH